MADEIPGAGPPPRPKWQRIWHEYTDYLDVHLSHMRTLEREGIIVHDSISFLDVVDRSGTLIEVHVSGVIECAHDVRLRVDKWLEVRNGAVKGRDYAYHAWLPPDRPLIRYDNAEGHGGFHRHVFNVRTGEELTIEPLTHDDLPTLDQIVREAVALGRLAAL